MFIGPRIRRYSARQRTYIRPIFVQLRRYFEKSLVFANIHKSKEEAGDMGAQPSLTATDSQFWPILPQKPDADYQIHYDKCIDDRIANTF